MNLEPCDGILLSLLVATSQLMPSVAKVYALIAVLCLSLALVYHNGNQISQFEQRRRKDQISTFVASSVNWLSTASGVVAAGNETARTQIKAPEVFAAGNALSTIQSTVDTYHPRIQSPSGLSPNSSLHWPDVEFVDLFDWEQQSLEGIVSPNVTSLQAERACKPAHGIPSTCCVGSIASQELSKRSCAGKTYADYESLRDVVMQKYLQPLPSSSSSTKCDACRIVDLCHQYNITFGIYGDSMTRQAVVSFECELQRRGYRVNKTIVNPKNYNILSITSPEWGDRPVVLHHYTQYKVPQRLDALGNPGNHPDVNAIMLSYGLHYSLGAVKYGSRPESYRESLKALFEHLGNKTDNYRLLLHRETSAQHFDADGGDYFFAKNSSTSSKSCVPMWPNSTSAGWRESFVHEAAEHSEFEMIMANELDKMTVHEKKQVVVLPFFNYTKELHHLHPASMDCTHFCQVPYLFWPLWRSWRLVLDRRVEQLHNWTT